MLVYSAIAQNKKGIFKGGPSSEDEQRSPRLYVAWPNGVLEVLHKPCASGKTNLNFCMWVAPVARRAAVLIYPSMAGKGAAAVASWWSCPVSASQPPRSSWRPSSTTSWACLHHLLSHFPVPGPLQRSHPGARRSRRKPLLYLSLREAQD